MENYSNRTSGHGHDSGGKGFAETFKTDEEGQVLGAVSGGLSAESEVDGSGKKAVTILLDRGGSQMSEVVLRIMVVGNVGARVFALNFPWSEHLQSSLGP